MDGGVGGISARVHATVRASMWGAVAGSTGVVGLLFLLIALFIWLSSQYDVLTACVVLGLLFVIVALAAALMFAQVRRRPDAPTAERVANPAAPWWLEPWVLGSLLQVVRVAGARRTSILLVAALASGFLLSSIQSSNRQDPAE
jgi:Putative Actinobacterial Holin-X, holin superfamily III